MQRTHVRSVLVVEDEKAILELMTEELRDHGFIVHAAETAEDGLRILEQQPDIDLLFTDIRLPGRLDGWDLAEQARRERPGLKVIYATGYSAVPSRILPGARFFKKPYRISSVMEDILRM